MPARQPLPVLVLAVLISISGLANAGEPFDPCEERRKEVQATERRIKRIDDNPSATTAPLEEQRRQLLRCTCKQAWQGIFEPRVPIEYEPLGEGPSLQGIQVAKVEWIAVAVSLGLSMDFAILPYLHGCNKSADPPLERATFTVQIAADGKVSNVMEIHMPSEATKPVACMTDIINTFKQYFQAPGPYGYVWTFTPQPAECSEQGLDWQSYNLSPPPAPRSP